MNTPTQNFFYEVLHNTAVGENEPQPGDLRDERIRAGPMRNKRFSQALMDKDYVQNYLHRYSADKLSGQAKRFMEYVRQAVVAPYQLYFNPDTGLAREDFAETMRLQEALRAIERCLQKNNRT
jgi:hypothetical protein